MTDSRVRLLALICVAAAAIVWLAVFAAPASAAIGLQSFAGSILDENGQPYTQAGGHQFEATTEFRFDTLPDGKPVEDAKDVLVSLPPGFIGSPPRVPVCPSDHDTQNVVRRHTRWRRSVRRRPRSGSWKSSWPANSWPTEFPIYNLEPPPGFPARFGVTVLSPDIALDAIVRPDDYGVDIISRDTSQGLSLNWVKVTIWGIPADPAHDPMRCLRRSEAYSVAPPPALRTPFLTLPMNCSAGPLTTTIKVNSWQNPDEYETASFDHDVAHGNTPMEVDNCDPLGFDPSLEIQPTTDSAETGTGLHADLDMPQNENPDGFDTAHLKKSVVTLPEGVTVNPSAAEGLEVCTPARYSEEKIDAAPEEGCPSASRIGSVEIESPALNRNLTGSLYQAQQDDPKTTAPGAENPFDSMLALYVVAQNKERGVLVKLAGKVTPNERTGQLVTTFDRLPQLPFNRFSLKFREGSRAVLVTPPKCGSFASTAEFVPWSAVNPENPLPSEIVRTSSPFEVKRGVNGGPCPTGGIPPFKPGLIAGTLNNAAGHYSPFYLRLTRGDGEQGMTNFSIKLPPGITGKLAGVPFCGEAAIAAAKDPNRSGKEELANPSCPQASEVGRTLAGVGVGPVLTQVPGKVYLAGPYNNSALSIVAVTSAAVGPFDVGTVVVREALKVNPETAEVFIDATGSDPIPHIIDGIPTHLRDLRVYVDRPEFTLNPTSCARTSTASTVLGSGLDFAAAADNQPVTVTTPFQAADCAALGFKPKLDLRLSGATKRGDNPRFRAVLEMKRGEANISRAQVTLPHSAFLDQSHIRTVCTRVQFAQGSFPGEKCPPGSIYGYAKAITPLLDEPIEGPVFLRSSSNPLPDLVAALHNGRIDINVIGRIDSVGEGQIRNTFASVPDAPVSKFTLTMQGGKKGLLINSTNVCRGKHRAAVKFTAHNGKVHDFKPLLRASCGKKARGKSKRNR